jgi:predicted DNA-binding transcriptional regulator YafY
MMQKKQTPDRSYGEKLIRLFARLMFTGQKHSLSDLARFLGCSKQTVLRLVDDITLAYDVPLRDEMRAGRKWVWIERGDHHTGQEPAALLSEGEHRTLQMCRAFTEHLLGRDTFDEIERAIEKSGHHLPAGVEDGTVFGVVRSGVIDYTKHEDVLRALLTGMEHRRVCEVRYRSLGAPQAKTFHIKPLQIFAHHETVYVHARRARTPGQPYKAPKYDPLLALHRFENVETTEVPFRRPSGYSFEKVMNQGFGVWTQKRFRVVIELDGWAAAFARERTWSPDQKIDDLPEGRLALAFWSTSEPEVMSLLLGFGACARLREPAALVEKVRHEVDRMGRSYATAAELADSPSRLP